MTQCVFEMESLLQAVEGDTELAIELLKAFLEDCDERTGELEGFIEAEDAERASRAAHSIKGMAGVVRCGPLSKLAFNMEHAGTDGDMEKLKSFFAQYKEIYGQACEQMREELAGK